MILHRILIACLLGGIFYMPQTAAHATDRWVSPQKAYSTSKTERRKGNMPSSVKCRNKEGVANRLRPEVQISWKKNTSDIQWTLIMFKGSSKWHPTERDSSKPWKKVSNSRFRVPSTGATFDCALWHNRKLRASDSDAHKYISAATNNGGYKTIKLR